MSRPLPLLILGLWLGALLASWVAASVNFRTVDRVLGPALRPEVATKMSGVPAEDRRVVLRHLASEINRWIFGRWSAVQVLLGVALLAATWSQGGAGRTLAGAALGLVLLQAAAVGPIVDLGRAIDFVPRPLPPDTQHRFALLHAAYVGSDLVKALLLAAAAWLLSRR